MRDEPRSNRVPPEDEDLFDFPLVEMKLELDPEPIVPIVTVSSPLPSSRETDAHAPSITPAMARVEPAPAPPVARAYTTPAPSAAPLPVAPAPVAIAPEEPPRRRLRFSRRRVTWAVLGVLFLMNVSGLWYVWRSHSSIGATVQEMRVAIDKAAKRTATQAAAPVVPIETPHPSDQAPVAAPVGALERNSIEIATREIENGEYVQARARLARLLAQADAMAPSLRAEIEPRATFLMADSYFDQARARGGSKR